MTFKEIKKTLEGLTIDELHDLKDAIKAEFKRRQPKDFLSRIMDEIKEENDKKKKGE